MIGEDGAEGYSDLFRENAMLQKENGALRLRVKAMQEAIDAINNRVTHLMSQEANLLLAKAGESGCTGPAGDPPPPHTHPRILGKLGGPANQFTGQCIYEFFPIDFFLRFIYFGVGGTAEGEEERESEADSPLSLRS